MSKEYVFIGNAQNKTRDFINQIIKENKDLQQRIDKVIDLITNHHDDLIIISDDGRSVEINFKRIVSILQGEEVKNNGI